MADVADYSKLRDAMLIKDDALRYLRMTEDLQRERWEKLRGVIQDAGNQYTSMRIDMVEERLRDQGSPLWLEVILTVGVEFIPQASVATKVLSLMTRGTQKVLTHANHKLLQTYQRRRISTPKFIANETERLGDEIKLTGDMVAQFAKYVGDPVLNASLNLVVGELKETVGKQLFMQDSGHGSERKMVQRTDAPIVVVTQSLRRWIETQVRAELIARHMIEHRVKDLFEIATSPTPAKEAKAKEAVAQERRALSKEPLPKNNKAALDQLTELRSGLAPDPGEDSGDVKTEEYLQELRLTIESIIWATTYDFTPIVKRSNMNRDDPKVWPYWYVRMEPAPLPEGLWKRLIERYIDPYGEGKNFKEAGHLSHLPGVIGPPDPSSEAQNYSPEVRLSSYFSKVLYRRINDKNNEMLRRLQRFRAL